MSVLIKGMEMPKCCADCRFRQYEYCDLQRQDVYAVNIMDYALSLERHPNCPLIEVPAPHGRLIDASQRITVAIPNGLKCITVDKFIDEYAVRNAPTVIEAED